MEYHLILDKKLSQEVLIEVVLRWLRNEPPDGPPAPSATKSPGTGVTGRPRSTVPPTPKGYRVQAPAHHIHSGHNLSMLGQIALRPGVFLRQLSALGGHRRHLFVVDNYQVLTVDAASLHHHWQPLPFPWFRPLLTTIPTVLPLLAAGDMATRGTALTDDGIAGMSATRKLIIAAGLGMQGIEGQVAAELWEMVRKTFFTPEGLAFLVAVTVALFLFGEPIVLGLALFGAAMGLFDLLTEVVDLFKQYYETAAAVRSRADLVKAGEFFAKAAAKGLLDLIDIFFSVRSSLRSVAVLAETGWQPGVWLAFIERVLARWQSRMGGGRQLMPIPLGPALPGTPPATPPLGRTRPPILKSEGKTPDGNDTPPSSDGGKMGRRAKEKGYDGVETTTNGGPSFKKSQHLYPTEPGQKNVVKIKMKGSRYQDFKEANKQAGIAGAEAPEGYVWHHVDDYDPVSGECTMELVEQKAHRSTYPHKGSVYQYEQHNNVKYK